MYQPVIIIGAARSGTNMLRDVLTSLPGFATWPCDEINYIWRYGNAGHPVDEFTVDHATSQSAKYIRRQFDKMARRIRADFLVEKTCANSLRVGFIDAVIPNAKYIFITRDGRDVVPSAMKCWSNPINLGYIARKARFVPWRDIPFYGSRYLLNRMFHAFSGKQRLAFWGPKFEGMEECLKSQTLAEVCATQWTFSVKRSIDAFEQLDHSKVFPLRYEDFVSEPLENLTQLIEFLGASVPDDELNAAVPNVSTKSVGNWQRVLDELTIQAISPIVNDTLIELGYIDPPSTLQFPQSEGRAAA